MANDAAFERHLEKGHGGGCLRQIIIATNPHSTFQFAQSILSTIPTLVASISLRKISTIHSDVSCQ